MNKDQKSNWRQRVLDRLDSMQPDIVSSIPTEELEEMYKIAAYYDPENVDQFEADESSIPHPQDVAPSSLYAPSHRLLSASCSYLQKMSTPDVPFHIQIVVPGTSGTAAADNQQTYEISVWERSLLEIICDFDDMNFIFFEFCTGVPPLIIDVFAAPDIEATPLYWKSAFETETQSEVHTQIQKLHSRSMKGVYPPNRSYIAVTFTEGGGLGKIWEGGEEPRQLAIDVVSNMWSTSKMDPPEGIEDKILSFDRWPR
ncbi:hypothetical protein M9Y10_021943 [Tritrichomonas musculus]|uniref:Uncharacterized protein n=1 Tax=Tritrichomonas musculus TaxID=1915356 RepID=A0ABR2KRS9_9EUKA